MNCKATKIGHSYQVDTIDHREWLESRRLCQSGHSQSTWAIVSRFQAALMPLLYSKLLGGCHSNASFNLKLQIASQVHSCKCFKKASQKDMMMYQQNQIFELYTNLWSSRVEIASEAEGIVPSEVALHIRAGAGSFPVAF